MTLSQNVGRIFQNTAQEEVYLVIWTQVESLSREQLNKAMAKKTKQLAEKMLQYLGTHKIF